MKIKLDLVHLNMCLMKIPFLILIKTKQFISERKQLLNLRHFQYKNRYIFKINSINASTLMHLALK